MSKLVINCKTGESVIREYTKLELEQQEIDRANAESKIKAEELKIAEQNEKRQILLNRLGISEEEAKLLLG